MRKSHTRLLGEDQGQAGAAHRGRGDAQPLPQLDWTPTVTRGEYEGAIHEIKTRIAAGSTYQVNYTYHPGTGLLRSQVDQARASRQQAAATYRQTVLDSFREVEDYLVQLSVLERESRAQQEAVDAANESRRLMENQYKAGTVDYTSVVTVQTAALSNERTGLTLLSSRLTASVQLIAALGGGWERVELDALEKLDEQLKQEKARAKGAPKAD